MITLRDRPTSYMTLAEDARGCFVAAEWISKFFMLGRQAARWSRSHAGTQLVVVLSVPVRDFAAVLVGCGWMTATPAPYIPPVREVLADLPTGSPVRVVTPNKIFTERFRGVNGAKDRARFDNEWEIGRLRAVAPLGSPDTSRSQLLNAPGVISQLTGMDRDWPARLCSPPQDLALVGTRKWLDEDLPTFLGLGDERESVANILLPVSQQSATWSTRIYTPSQLEDGLPANVRAVLLDGASATKYLSAIEVPVVISILDRSVADDSAPESVLNYRNTQGKPVSLEHELRWKSPPGVEVLGFGVPL